LVHVDAAHRVAVEPLPKPQPVQNTRRVRRDLNAAADFDKLRRLLVDIDLEAGTMEAHRDGKATDPPADHGDPKRLFHHRCSQETPSACVNRA
jgi:hypothetical protein